MTRLQTENCVHFTEDAKDDFVVTLAGASTSYTNDCYAKHRTPLLTLTPGGEDDFRRLAPWLVPPPTFNIARMARLLPIVLSQTGFLTQKMAVVAFDRSPEKPLAERQLIPGINERGGKVVDVAYVPLNYDAIASQTASAVLRFKTQGVDRVVFLAPGGGEVGVFTNAAESQNYRPRYGLSSLDNPDFATTLMPAAQRPLGAGPGVLPGADVGAAKRPSLTPRQRSCLDYLNRKTGSTYSGTDTVSITALARCEMLYLIQAGYRGLTDRAFAAADVRSSFFAIGDSFASYLSPKLRFSPDAVDAIGSYARFAWDATCGCFAYTTPFMDMPPGV